jgi:hypothetical protein
MAYRRIGEVHLVAKRRPQACRAFGQSAAIWDGMQREGVLLGFDLAEPSGQVPWIRKQLRACGVETL